MEQIHQSFLQALGAALKNTQVNWEVPVDWSALFQMAEKHHVLPLVYESVYACPAAKTADAQLMALVKRKTIQIVMLQTMKTSEFLGLYSHLRERGLTPLVIKGLVCRSLYPNPDYRISGDEDVLISPDQFVDCQEAMEKFGMQPTQPSAESYEVPYAKPGTPLYIELHRSLFPPENEAYGELNHFFEKVHDRAVPMTVDGVQILTMAPTDHLFYLICHSFKHFLHSGFGIRQVCDIVLFSNAYGKEIDWEQVLVNCKAIRADRFAAAMFHMGQAYLTFDPEKACWPRSWREIEVDAQPMLEELLDAGIYGDGSMSRKHSAHLTLNAVAAQKQGRKTGSGVLKSLFPAASALETRYPYLKRRPYLLPVAWGSRILKYGRETWKATNNDAAGAIQIGSERIELMRKYGIIE